MGLSDYFTSFSTKFWEKLRLPQRISHDLIWGLMVGIAASLSSTSAALMLQDWRRKKAMQRIPPRPIELRSDEIVSGVVGLIGIRRATIYIYISVDELGTGNTPLLRINSLSDALGVEILFLNPGGSVKDRVALQIIEDAEAQGLLHPNTGSVLFEGTVGSTGISLATVGKAKGYECYIIMPDDVAIEKVQVLEKLEAKVERVKPASIVDQKQNLARRRALDFGKTKLTNTPSHGEDVAVSTFAEPSEVEHTTIFHSSFEHEPRGFFADQFENESNFKAHYRGTGPEILRQTNGRLDAFVSGAGTGGTIAGTGSFLKKPLPNLIVALSDPEGSGLFNKVKYNVMFDPKESEGKKRRHQVDTVVEGIGINRITHNFSLGLPIIDTAYRISDAEAVAMSRFLVQHDGLFLGSSSACNLVACIHVAKTIKRGSRIVTILCDSGSRHQSKFWSDDYLNANGIPIDQSIIERLLRS
nr:cysteine synthase A [Cryptococcus depauperatus CBS 7855]